MTTLAIISGTGALPATLGGTEALYVTFSGVPADIPAGADRIEARFEQLGAMFDALRVAGIKEVVLAGAMSRPSFDPAALDAFTAAAMPRLMAAMGGGDDGLLQVVMEMFTDQGFVLKGAHELRPDLVLGVAVEIGAPDNQARADIARGQEILAALSALDLGQGCVVAGGLCLGIETLQGTDFLLDTVARSAPHLKRAPGVFVKLPKEGQDLRADMPTIGPDTIAAVARAGLGGVAIKAGAVLVLERGLVERALAEHGLFLVTL